ncbi:MAG: hypothetical protein JST31_03135 [Actinobacteria bacterium]|nr:hypothetical protein [Actinomycetota bacterium]
MNMKKLRLAVGLLALALAVVAGSSSAEARGPSVCTEGVIPAGSYGALTVTGNCTFGEGEVTINGNLSVAPGAVLNDHAMSSATVHVTGNVMVGAGGVVGLGTYAPAPSHDSAVVDGNVIGNGAATLYLGGMTIHGNLLVKGGGDAGRNLPIKDDTIDGNVIVQRWTGLWFGIIRDEIGGNAIVNNNSAADPTTDPGIDSSEIVTNTIRGNLICSGNTPAPQVGDSEGATNTVGGQKLGQCAGL